MNAGRELEEYRTRLRQFVVWLYAGSVLLVLVWLTFSVSLWQEPSILVLLAVSLFTAAVIHQLPWGRWPSEVFLVVTGVASAQIATGVLLGLPVEDLFFFVVFIAGLYYRGGALAAAVGMVALANLLFTPAGSPHFLLRVALFAVAAVLANQLYLSLRNLAQEMEEKVEERTLELSIAYGVAALLSHPGELNGLLQAALDYLLSGLGKRCEVDPTGWICLVDPATRKLRLAAARGPAGDVAVPGREFSLDECPCGVAAAREKDSLDCRNAFGGSCRCLWGIKPQAGERCRIVPLISEERVEGLLYLAGDAGNLDGEGRFPTSLGWTLGMAVYNGRLRELAAGLATHDGLTGLLNHREFRFRLEKEVERGLEERLPLSLLLLDLDHFKEVNDTFGHLAGDAVLEALGGILREVSRSSDVTARYGGEEFTVLLPGLERAQAVAVAERLRRIVEGRPVPVGETTVPVTVSVGVSSLGGEVAGAVGLLEAADRALYAAKVSGRNRVEVG